MSPSEIFVHRFCLIFTCILRKVVPFFAQNILIQYTQVFFILLKKYPQPFYSFHFCHTLSLKYWRYPGISIWPSSIHCLVIC